MKFLTFLKYNYSIILTLFVSFGSAYMLIWKNIPFLYEKIIDEMIPYGTILTYIVLYLVSFIVAIISIIFIVMVTVEITKQLNKQKETE